MLLDGWKDLYLPVLRLLTGPCRIVPVFRIPQQANGRPATDSG